MNCFSIEPTRLGATPSFSTMQAIMKPSPRLSLVEKGVAVTFVTPLSSFAPKLEASLSSEPALQRLAKGKFRLVTYAKLLSVGDGSCTVAPRYGGAAFEIEAETLVYVSHNAAARELVDELAGEQLDVIPVGDARSPRYLQAAIREGHLAARFI